MPNDKTYLLAGDIGGTKTHLGLYSAGPDGPLAVADEIYASREAGSLEEMITRLLERHRAPVTAACFGIAGPVKGGSARLTNLDWGVSADQLREHFHWKHVQLVNDLTATALAVAGLKPEELFPLNRAGGDQAGAMALVAPGTGLGLALMMNAGGGYTIMASEGGHADFPPKDEDEIRLWRYLRRRYEHVSLERVLSGQGLVNIYDWLRAEKPAGESARSGASEEIMHAADPARAITRHALESGDGLCRAALLRFCRILGAAAGNLALTGLATGGVYLGGGIPPKILPILEKSDFMTAFRAKGRFSDLLETIPVRVIRNDRAALMGAARRAFELATGQSDPAGAGQP